jgi:hypothetical protein
MSNFTLDNAPIAVARKYVYPNISDSSMQIIEALCTCNGLDIIKKPYTVIKDKGQDKILLSAAGYLMMAHNTKELDGIDDILFGPDIVLKADGQEFNVPSTARATVYRKQQPYCYVIYASEYCNSYAHLRYPHMFMSKWATSMAIRLAFTDVVGAMVSAEELDAKMDFNHRSVKVDDFNHRKVDIRTEAAILGFGVQITEFLEQDPIIAEALKEATVSGINNVLTDVLTEADKKHQEHKVLAEFLNGPLKVVGDVY